jgi:hypothetical protein
MTKISDLGRITGANTKTSDLFVTVSLDLGASGTKNITRGEMAKAIQQEDFDDIKITGGNITNVNIINPNISVENLFIPDISEDDYFYLKNFSLGETVAISYSQLYKEIAKTSKKSNKVYVSTEGNDLDVGSYLNPVASLEKAVEIAQNNKLNEIATAITVLPGDYYTNGELALPDLCTIVSTNGQYATKIIMNQGYEKTNCILLGSGSYAQGFSFFNLIVDNFDYPTKGFAYAFRPGVRIIRSPYIRDSSQISNYFSDEIAPLLNPLNNKGTIEDLGYEITLSSIVGVFEVGDSIFADNGVVGVISRIVEIDQGIIFIRNNTGDFEVGGVVTSASGGTATIDVVGEEDFPNKNVGRGGGLLLADRSQVDQDSIFPYVLAFGATPRSQNGLGYVATNGAGINGIGSISVFARCSFYALNGGQITLNNSGTQFGDISMRAKGSTPVFNPNETATSNLVKNINVAEQITQNTNAIVNDMWTHIETTLGYIVDEELTRRDAANLLKSLSNDFREGSQKGIRVFTASLFNYKGRHVFSVFNPTTSGIKYIGSLNVSAGLPAGSTVDVNDAYILYTSPTNFYEGEIYYWNGNNWISDGQNDTTLLNAFIDSFNRMGSFIIQNLDLNSAEDLMVNSLIEDILISSLKAPTIISFGSLVESLSHQFNLASAGVNVNALPLNFRRLGQPVSATASVLQEDGGRVRWSGADELNNQYFARGLKINGTTGRLEGRPFTSSVRKLARRASNSRAIL